MYSPIDGEPKSARRYCESQSLQRNERRIKTNPPTVTSFKSFCTLAALPIFSRLVTAGVTMSFFLNNMLSLIFVHGRNKSSGFITSSKGDILPPRNTRTPLLPVLASSFLKVAPVKIEQTSFNLHQFQLAGISKGMLSVISYISEPICS